MAGLVFGCLVLFGAFCEARHEAGFCALCVARAAWLAWLAWAASERGGGGVGGAAARELARRGTPLFYIPHRLPCESGTEGEGRKYLEGVVYMLKFAQDVFPVWWGGG